MIMLLDDHVRVQDQLLFDRLLLSEVGLDLWAWRGAGGAAAAMHGALNVDSFASTPAKEMLGC